MHRAESDASKHGKHVNVIIKFSEKQFVWVGK